MTELDKGQKADQRPKKYLWFGFGNYSGLPNLQVGGGNVRDPGLFEELLKTSKTERSPTTFFVYVAAGLIGLMALALLLAWGLLLILR